MIQVWLLAPHEHCMSSTPKVVLGSSLCVAIQSFLEDSASSLPVVRCCCVLVVSPT
jgi:hypothetical protein